MYWVKSVAQPSVKLLVVDTKDGAEEWHDFEAVKQLMSATDIQIFGVKKVGTKYSVKALEDPRDFLLRQLKDLARREHYGYFDSAKSSDSLDVRYFGHWEISEDDKREMMEEYGYIEDDWDWKIPTADTFDALSRLMKNIKDTYGYSFTFCAGEKEWISFSTATICRR